MWVCRICRFAVTLDDVAVASSTGRCICLPCFAAATGSLLTMSKALRSEMTAILAEIEPAEQEAHHDPSA
jgi:hypothetical protein